MAPTKRMIFVTVGTTQFDLLIKGATNPQSLTWMKANGYTHLVVQYGKGDQPVIDDNNGLSIESYDFKPSLDDDMKSADLILSHAGAGTVMEALRLQKRLVVVINTKLMNNHQTELAHAMAKRGHLFVVDEPTDLVAVTDQKNCKELWNDFDSFCPIPHEGAGKDHEYDFANLLNRHMGIST